MIEIRPAEERDLQGIREIFLASYGQAYAYPQYYDLRQLKKMLFSEDTLLLVAIDPASGRVAGTASVLLQIGAYADLVGEFGRLAVHPDFRGRGIGTALMRGRLERVRERLHLGLVEPRTNHPYSQKIAVKHHFAPVGFLPQNLLFSRRESALVCAQYFGDALELRRNHPRVIPEAYPLAALAEENCGLRPDLIVDDEAPSYPHVEDFELDEMRADGYAGLLRIQRGRVRNREIFGPLRLHYGLFKLRARHSTYLLARDQGRIVGAIGCLVDEIERAVRIFELISLSEEPAHFLLDRLLARCRDDWATEYVEVDVSAYAPRMQRTLLELGFQPAAYIPAMVFQDVERLDMVKMCKLLVPPDFREVVGVPATLPLMNLVMNRFLQAAVLPQVVEAAERMPLLADLTPEQVREVASVCVLQSFAPGETIVQQSHLDGQVYLVLEGAIAITANGAERQLACLGPGDCLGERALLRRCSHSATATAIGHVQTAMMPHGPLLALLRRRPDVGGILYRNIARGLCEKLRNSDQLLTDGSH